MTPRLRFEIPINTTLKNRDRAVPGQENSLLLICHSKSLTHLPKAATPWRSQSSSG